MQTRKALPLFPSRTLPLLNLPRHNRTSHD